VTSSSEGVAEHGGRIVKSAGDGVLAVLEGPGNAVRAATAIGEGLRGPRRHDPAGVHIGEIETVGDDVAGVSVNITARISALVGPEEVLVSSAVKDFTPGASVFEDAGEHELEGVPGTWRLSHVVET
jgi:class 3 adenylate cyclase